MSESIRSLAQGFVGAHQPPRILVRSARIAALAVIIGIGINHLYWAVTGWTLPDMEVYWNAAMRLREGGQLYGGEVTPYTAYRYAPWFAYAWVPLTYLPVMVVRVLWSVSLLVGGALAVRPLWEHRSTASSLMLLIFVPMLVASAAGGNVQAVMLGVMVSGMNRRWGPFAIGAAASLKFVPLAFLLVYVARREWWKVVGGGVTTLALLGPAMLLPIAPVTFDPGVARTVPTWAWLTIAPAVGLIAFALSLRHPRYAGIAAGVSAVLGLPRLFLYETTILLAGTVSITAAPAARADEDGDDEFGHVVVPELLKQAGHPEQKVMTSRAASRYEPLVTVAAPYPAEADRGNPSPSQPWTDAR